MRYQRRLYTAEKYILWATIYYVADIIGLSSFVYPLLPSKIAKSGLIPTKFDLTAVQGHPRSPILVSMESPRATFY